MMPTIAFFKRLGIQCFYRNDLLDHCRIFFLSTMYIAKRKSQRNNFHIILPVGRHILISF